MQQKKISAPYWERNCCGILNSILYNFLRIEDNTRFKQKYSNKLLLKSIHRISNLIGCLFCVEYGKHSSRETLFNKNKLTMYLLWHGK